MIIMKSDATQEQIRAVVKDIETHGLRADISQGDFRTIIGLIVMNGKYRLTILRCCPESRRQEWSRHRIS